MIRRWICQHFHQKIHFAGGASYRCASCGLEWPAPWANNAKRESEALVLLGMK